MPGVILEAPMDGIGFSEIVFIAIVFLLGIYLLLFWIKTLVQCINSDTDNSSKIKWVILMLLTGFLGSFVYNLFGSKGSSEKKIG